MDKLPRLRPLEVTHLPEEEGNSFLLRDPKGYADDELILSEGALFVAAYLDGEHDLAQLQAGFRERYGHEPAPADIESLVRRLDEAGMLESEAFRERRDRAHEAFLSAPVRPPAHSGAAYPADPKEAQEKVESFRQESADLEEEGDRPAGTLRALVAPHVDLRVGGACSALAYRLLEEAPQVKTVVVLGTAHACPHPAWIVLEKPYDTPLGPVPVDEKACRRLALASPSTAEELYLHRREHSVEFQALFLAALRRAGRDIRIVPVLCGSLRGEDGEAEVPSPDADPFLVTLRELVEERGEEIVVAAGADLAHVGPRFGDKGALSEEGLAFLESQDRRTLDAVSDGDAAGFYRSVMEDGDSRRICGLSPIYALLTAVPGARGKVLCYEQANDPTGTVSYASMGLWR